MSRWLKYLAVLLTLSLALGACSRVGLAYRNLDVIIPWTLSDYLDMNGEQKGWFNERLKEHLSWHCTTQLPGYLDWLDRLQTMVETNQVTDAALQARTQEAKQAIAADRPGNHPVSHRVVAGAGRQASRGDERRLRQGPAQTPGGIPQTVSGPTDQGARRAHGKTPERLARPVESDPATTGRGLVQRAWATRTRNGSPTAPIGRSNSVRPLRSARVQNSHSESRRFW